MRQALAADFAALQGVAAVVTNDRRLPAGTGRWRSVQVGPGQERAALALLAARADCTLVIAPETDEILADRARILERAGGRTLGSSPEAIALCGDKARTAEHLARAGIRTPPARVVIPAHGLPDDLSYPAVLKPIDGAGSVSTYYVGHPDELLPEARALPHALVQPFIPGQAMSASYLVDAEGKEHLIGVGKQDVRIHQGRFTYHGGTWPAEAMPPCEEARRAVASVSGLRGFVGVDFVWSPPEPTITVLEINPRPTTSIVGLCRLLPPGALASAWLNGLEDPGSVDFDELAEQVRCHPTVRFSSDADPA